MTATVKEFCRINGIAENSDNLVDIIYNALIGGDCDGGLDEDCGQGTEKQAPIPDSYAGKTDS